MEKGANKMISDTLSEAVSNINSYLAVDAEVPPNKRWYGGKLGERILRCVKEMDDIRQVLDRGLPEDWTSEESDLKFQIVDGRLVRKAEAAPGPSPTRATR
jgi:hypothetical protein